MSTETCTCGHTQATHIAERDGYDKDMKPLISVCALCYSCMKYNPSPNKPRTKPDLNNQGTGQSAGSNPALGVNDEFSERIKQVKYDNKCKPSVRLSGMKEALEAVEKKIDKIYVRSVVNGNASKKQIDAFIEGEVAQEKALKRLINEEIQKWLEEIRK